MKVTKAQAQANRKQVVETASALFRERGFDGVGVADLMAAAGFTHGGFYKHFRSKTDLMAESAACGMAQTSALNAGMDACEFIAHYLSRRHRDNRAAGCTMAALGADAARQPEAVRAAFAAGIESLLSALSHVEKPSQEGTSSPPRAMLLGVLAQAVGAIVLSRACPDDAALADEVLAVCYDQILASLKSNAMEDGRQRDQGKSRTKRAAPQQSNRRSVAGPTAKTRRKAE